MAPRSAEEKERRKLLQAQKQEASKLKKEKKEVEDAAKNIALAKLEEGKIQSTEGHASDGYCYFLTLPDDAQNQILCFTEARDLGAISMTCRGINFGLAEARVSHILSRLNTKANADADQIGRLSVPIKFCDNEAAARNLLAHALHGSGETGRLVTKKSKKVKGCGADEYIAYARFLEEAVQGHAVQNLPGQKSSTLVSHCRYTWMNVYTSFHYQSQVFFSLL